MKVASVFTFGSRFDYSKPVVDGENLVYEFVRSDKAMVIPMTGGTVQLLTTEPLEVGSKVTNLTDSRGNLVFSVGGVAYEMYVHSAEPQFSPYQVIIGWKHTLRRNIPKDIDAILEGLG